MRRVGQRDTAPELALRRNLHACCLRFRVARRAEGIRADVVFFSARVAVFVDGCFWHCRPIHGTMPCSNKAYWLPKLQSNVERDRRQTLLLQNSGWTVVRVWEHDCRGALVEVVERITELVRQRRR